MNCTSARELFANKRAGRLDPPEARELDAHLAGCDACRRELAADDALTAALERLPARAAPAGLERSLRAKWAPAPEGPASPRLPGSARAPRRFGVPRVPRALAASLVAAAAIAAASLVVVRQTSARSDAMVAEAINDHLRVLYSDHPVEIESGGPHQVKPWFTGRVDFAPVTAFAGDADYPLQGGAVAYYVDRKAAAYVFKRRLHVITLFIFPSEGLPWPSAGLRPLGRAQARVETSRGFHTILWRDGDLGYALVSDVDEHDLFALGLKIVGD